MRLPLIALRVAAKSHSVAKTHPYSPQMETGKTPSGHPKGCDSFHQMKWGQGRDSPGADFLCAALWLSNQRLNLWIANSWRKLLQPVHVVLTVRDNPILLEPAQQR